MLVLTRIQCNEGISGRLGLTVKGDNSGIPNGVSNKGCSTLRWRFEAVMWIGGRRKWHVTIRGLSRVEKKYDIPIDEIDTVNPMVLLELFSMYRDWQEAKIQTISKKQEEVENKIEVADALTGKLLQRFNYSVSTMKTTSHHLSEVHALQVDLGELKGRLTEVISNCDSLCKRINAEGPESLRSSVKPFSVTSADLETSCRSHGKSVK
ncbi:hypothetical protein HYC85_002149 [Camellia sinensis]|uniref:Uncharacterized protein n=1 Tax=Camellia sinensis TaxID=4442 RepID=A0A7J7I7E1_CAMSI|nr:hypothetical protein HYC85_002149 [Camellia sinensis]